MIFQSHRYRYGGGVKKEGAYHEEWIPIRFYHIHVR